MSIPRPDELLELDFSAASEAYAPSTASSDAVWPRATVRFTGARWAVKIRQSPVVPARRQGLLLAGMYADRDKAFEFARYEVGILRFTTRKFSGGGRMRPFADVVASQPARVVDGMVVNSPKAEPSC